MSWTGSSGGRASLAARCIAAVVLLGVIGCCQLLCAAEVDQRQDQVAQDEWGNLLRRELRSELLASARVSSEERAKRYRIELDRVWRSAADTEMPGWEEVAGFTYVLMAYAAEPAAQHQGRAAGVDALVGRLQSLMREAGTGEREQWMVARILGSSTNPMLQAYGTGMQRVLELWTNPLQLQLTLLDGASLDLVEWRGKVVLVDFWRTSCSGCIAAMPRIRQIYQRHHDKGFEVVAICLDSGNNRDRFDEIRKTLDAPWPHAWVELSQPWQQTPLIQRFAITGVPRYLLLDKSGRLAGTDFTGSDGAAKLESEVQRLLGSR